MLEARNAGKPIGDARGEMGMVADTFRYYAGAPERLLGDTIPVAGGLAFTVREPLGVVGLITPWNFPLAIASWKLAPALAAGNTVVLKPAELTPLTALRFARARARGRAARGRRQRRRRPGPRVRAAAGRAPRRGQDRLHRLDRGRPLDRRRAPRRRSSASRSSSAASRANVVFADADLEQAAAAAPLAVFGNAGQDCCARSRILVERSALDRFMEALEEAVSATARRRPARRGDADGPADLAPPSASTVASFVDDDAPVAIRGEAPDGPGFWFAADRAVPGRATTTAPRARRSSARSPCVIPFRDEAEAIALANDTIYGLSGSVWTRDGAKALRVARAIETGVLSINSNTSVRVVDAVRRLQAVGLRARARARTRLDAYTEVKTVYYATEDELMGRLDGKVCVITGAAGGIGAATAELLRARGRDGRRRRPRRRTRPATSRWRATSPTRTRCASIYARVREQFGRIDVLFNNAGHLARRRRLGARDRATRRGSACRTSTSSRSSSAASTASRTCSRTSGGGSVINTASFVAVMGAATSQISYTASKGGVLALSRELGVEFARRGVRVNALCPGPGRHAAAARAVRQGPRAGRAAPRPRADGPLRARPRRSPTARCSWPATSRRSSPPRPSWSTAGLSGAYVTPE